MSKLSVSTSERDHEEMLRRADALIPKVVVLGRHWMASACLGYEPSWCQRPRRYIWFARTVWAHEAHEGDY